MGDDARLSGLLREPDGSFSAGYGPFVLRSAFQPIFSQTSQGVLHLEAFEALIRPFKGSEAISPSQFFPLVLPGDAAEVEQLCRRLHLVNASVSELDEALVFLNIDPQFLTAYADMVHEVEALAELALYAGIPPGRIVCEIIEKHAGTQRLLEPLAETLRRHNFRIAIDDYGAEDSDFDRVEIVRPDIVKFDALWVRRFMETPEGHALLGAMVRQFRDRRILTLFEGLEQHWQVAACRELGVRLMQGYALAKPKLAPARYDRPMTEDAESETQVAETITTADPPDARHHRPYKPARRAVFGRRGC